MTRDPVCGMSVDEKKAAGKSELNGRSIYFCSLKCKERFGCGEGDRRHHPGKG